LKRKYREESKIKMGLEHVTSIPVKMIEQDYEAWTLKFEKSKILLSEYALQLLTSPRFSYKIKKKVEELVVISVAELGFLEGATLFEILEKIGEMGAKPCPLNLALSLRLRFDEERSETEITTGKAPTGSITLISKPLNLEDTFPKGFYIRKIEGVKWLRGYCCDAVYKFTPNDRIAFCKV